MRAAPSLNTHIDWMLDPMCAVPSGDVNPLFDELVARLHGENREQAEEALNCLRRGFVVDRSPEYRAPGGSCSLGAYLFSRGRVDLLERLVRMGPPQWMLDMGADAPFLRCMSPTAGDKGWWLCWLCSNTKGSSIDAGNPFDIAVYPVGEHSLQMLKLGMEFCPTHPAKSVVTNVPWRPGTLHYSMVHWTVNSPRISTDIHMVRARCVLSARPTITATMSEEDLGHHLAVLRFMREHAFPLCVADGQMDAFPFVTGFGPGSRLDVLRQVMGPYIEAGLVDINAPLLASRQDFANTPPIDAAIYTGSTGAAAYLVEMGCDITKSFVCSNSGGLAAAASLHGGPEMVAAVNEAVMRVHLKLVLEAPAAAARPRHRSMV